MTPVKAQAVVHVNNTPEAVLAYIADVRHRPLFLSMLKTISDVQGDPSAEGTTWKWTAGAFGVEFRGTARCLTHQPGRLYVSKTEGDVEGTVSYRVEPEGDGTRLTIESECLMPTRLPLQAVLERMNRAEAERLGESLKAILDR
jgi:carbon monoxide dehydrogenase subunit G